MAEEENITVGDLKSALKVMTVIHENIQSNSAYFKKNALSEIIEYLEERIEKVAKEKSKGDSD